jgi:aspartate ammonia-lyase
MPTRTESDLLGEKEVPLQAYYGIQTQRAIENFDISTARLKHYRSFIWALGAVKMAAAKANHQLGLLKDDMAIAIVQAAQEVMDGQLDDEFPIDMMQGGAGTSTNMNANEVIANRALEIMGYEKGDYEQCSPNDHVNMSQSTNDAYPTSIQLSLMRMNYVLIDHLKLLVASFRKKGEEFADIL